MVATLYKPMRNRLRIVPVYRKRNYRWMPRGNVRKFRNLVPPK